MFHHVERPLDLSRAPHEIRRALTKASKKNNAITARPPVELPRVEDRQIDMRDGAKIPIRIYTPSWDKDLPLIIYYHGGGFVIMDLDSHDRACRRISKKCNSIVVSIGYRLAPEHKFPVPVQDCYDAYLWAAKNATFLGADPSRITVMGDSAGGNLATVTAIQARDRRESEIKNQVLIYPVTDGTMSQPSIDQFAKGKFLTKELMIWFLNHYARTEDDIYHPLMSPIFTKDLSGLPRTFVTTAYYDPLKDEGKLYADKLIAADNDVLYKDYNKAIHGMLTMPRIVRQCDEMIDDIAQFLDQG